MKRWVVGFMFSEHHNLVLLLQKNRPAWQAGLLNGPGGKIEEGETPLQAMVREFREETTLETAPGDWHEFSHHRGYVRDGSGERFELFLFRSTGTQEQLNRALLAEVEEGLLLLSPHLVHNQRAFPNLAWHVAMAASFARGETTQRFDIEEIARVCVACGEELAEPEGQCCNIKCRETFKVRENCTVCKPGRCGWPGVGHVDPKHPPREECKEHECEQCGMRDCPESSETHYWHDGCAFCTVDAGVPAGVPA